MNIISTLSSALAVIVAIGALHSIYLRATLRWMCREKSLFSKGQWIEYHGKHPQVVNSRRVKSLQTELKKLGFTYIGAQANKTRLELGQNNIDLCYQSPNSDCIAVITCRRSPLMIPLILAEMPCCWLTGTWQILMNYETKLSDTRWVITLQMDPLLTTAEGSAQHPENFVVTYGGSKLSLRELLNLHQQAVEKAANSTSITLTRRTLTEFISDQAEQHELLKPGLARKVDTFASELEGLLSASKLKQ